LISWSQFHIS